MLRKFFAVVVLLPLAVILVAFAVANRQFVSLSLDPFGSGDSALSLSLPLFALAFALLIAGIIIGGIGAWFGQRKWRRQARWLGAENRRLREEREAPAPQDGASQRRQITR
jgi:hypothetical protein